MWPTPDQKAKGAGATLVQQLSRLRSVTLRKKPMETARELLKASATVWKAGKREREKCSQKGVREVGKGKMSRPRGVLARFGYVSLSDGCEVD